MAIDGYLPVPVPVPGSTKPCASSVSAVSDAVVPVLHCTPSGEVAGRAGRSLVVGGVGLGEKEGARGGSDDASTARGTIDETKLSSRKLTGRAMETVRFHQPPPPSLNFQRQRHTALHAASISFLIPDS